VVLSWLGMRDSPCRQKKYTFAATTLRAKGAGLVRWTNPFESQQHEPNKKTHFRGPLSLARDEGFEPPMPGPEPGALPLG